MSTYKNNNKKQGNAKKKKNRVMVQLSKEQQLSEFGYISASSLSYAEIEQLTKCPCEVLYEYNENYDKETYKIVPHFTRRFEKEIFISKEEYKLLQTVAGVEKDDFVVNLPVRIITGHSKDMKKWSRFQVFLYHDQDGEKNWKGGWFTPAENISIKLLEIPVVTSLKNEPLDDDDSKGKQVA